MEYLRLLGLDGKANDIQKAFANSTGIGKDSTQKIFAAHFMEKGEINLEAAIKAMDFKSQDTAQKVYQTVQRLMYKSWIGLSPTANIKQFLQPWLVGSAEIGPKWVRAGLKARKSKNPADLEAWKWAEPQIASSTGIDLLEKTKAQKIASTLSPKVEKAVQFAEAPGELGFRGFSWQDVNRNRKSIFLGARQQFLAEGASEPVLDGLLKAQRDKVLLTLKKHGAEAAAREYALTRSLRTNFMYSMADKPLALQEGIGQYIPFTTWGRNQWMRFLGDVESGNVAKLAKRIVYPLMMLTAVETATGYKIPRAHPVSALTGVSDVSLLPAFTGPIQELGKGRPFRAVKEAASAVPIANLLIKSKKAADKGLIEGSGLKPSRDPYTLPALLRGKHKREGK